mgnify:CR=1 FL=1
MEIVKQPNNILSKKLESVNQITPEIKGLISDMRKVMKENNGIGLAANQVGQDLKIFVIEENLAKEAGVPDAFMNPEITDYSKENSVEEEGCLSIPGYWVNIPRSKKIMFKALDENGKKIKFKAKNLLARVIQHEVDHLNGMLISDKTKN